MHIKAVLIGKSLLGSPHERKITEHLDNEGLPVYTLVGKQEKYHEVLWKLNLKRKEALVITVSQEEATAAHEAFCRCWLLDNVDEFTVDKVNEILHSTKYGL